MKSAKSLNSLNSVQQELILISRKLGNVPPDDKKSCFPAESKTSNHASGFRNLLRGNQRRDVIMKILGLCLSAAAGCIVPPAMLVYSESVEMLMAREHPNPDGFSPQLLLMKTFGGGGKILPGNATREEQMDALQDDIRSLNSFIVYFSLIQMVFATCGVALMKMSASNQAARIRRQLFRAAMQHDMTWFDMKSGQNLAANFNEQVAHIENGVGVAVAIMTMYLFNILSGLLMCLFISWKLTLAICSLIPLDMAIVFLISHFQNGVAAKETEASARVGNIFIEAISKIRTVLLFGGEDKEVAKYEKMLTTASRHSLIRGIFHGSAMSVTWAFNYLTCLVAFVYGAYLMQHGEQLSAISVVLSNAWIMTVRFGASFSLMQKVTTAASSALSVFRTIDAPHGIDPLAKGGVILSSFSGSIEFRNVHFCYPARPLPPVLNGVNFFIRQGETVAVVGPSGTGKSTVLHLLQRFYDAQSGSVEIDGVDVKMLNVAWMRQQMAVVGQEASLFAGTIWENIRFGLMSASDEQIIAAAKLANAHEFITRLPNGYDTVIGSKGATLSGGEKQRVAIARALVRNPRILLLDEPTSALDATSRDIVHAALRTASKGRTTLIVTHRLASTKSADRIIVLDGGQVVEDGTHSELIALNGIYKQLSLSEDKLEKNAAKSAPIEKSSALKLDAAESVDNERQDVLPEEQTVPVPRSIFLQWNKPEKWLLLAGILASAVSGTMICLGAVVYGEFMGSFAHTDVEEVRKQVFFFSCVEVASMVAMCSSVFFVVYLFTAARERLTNRLKLAAFSSIMKQESGWFDDARNHVGALYSRVSRDVLLIQDFTGPGIGTYIQSIFNLAVGFGISMSYSWKLTLATELMIPILFIAPVLDGIMSKKEDSLEMDHLSSASAFAAEAVSNKSMITSLGLERVMIARYNAALRRSDWRSKMSAVSRGIAFGITEAVPGLAFGFCFFYGAILMRDERLPFQEVVKLSEILLVGAWTVCSEVAFTTSFSTARQAASRMQYLLTRTSSIQDGSLAHIAPAKPDTADIRYTDVKMAYPTRPETMVLQQLNLEIAEGDNLAVVGASGCGKSSILHLLQRLYDPSAGSISLHGTKLQDLALPTLRHHLGHVSQEPSLFSGSIRDNIAYGDNTREIPMDEIIAAAKKANIHNFIAELPAGYDTELGEHAQLSGGQKQRVAIARALVRDPKILLLDEATSALDPESERVVQEALNLAAKGRTTITIAHRLGALAHSNRVLRLEAGRILDEKLQIKF